jgi:hypothetical protein
MDKQILEDAAIAAGIELSWASVGDSPWIPFHNHEPWTPATNLTQAAELALALNMSVQHFQPHGIHRVVASVSYVSETELHGNDKKAATCRAIVKCAAKCKQFIGK